MAQTGKSTTTPKPTKAEKTAVKAHDTVDSAQQKAHDAIDTAQVKADELKVRAQDAADTAQAKGEEVMDQVSTYVREHPVSAAGIAFAAGMLVSSLLRR